MTSCTPQCRKKRFSAPAKRVSLPLATPVCPHSKRISSCSEPARPLWMCRIDARHTRRALLQLLRLAPQSGRSAPLSANGAQPQLGEQPQACCVSVSGQQASQYSIRSGCCVSLEELSISSACADTSSRTCLVSLTDSSSGESSARESLCPWGCKDGGVACARACASLSPPLCAPCAVDRSPPVAGQARGLRCASLAIIRCACPLLPPCAFCTDYILFCSRLRRACVRPSVSWCS